MTAAGLATLFVTQSFLDASGGCQGNPDDPHVRLGIDWLGKNFDATFDVSREDFGGHFEPYALFAISRVGVASGLRYFGTVDWYQHGADYLIASQGPDGSWSSYAGGGTALGLLFLDYGSSPVAVEKLEYALPAQAGNTAVARWNQRPQDMLNFVDWMGHQLEHRLNWQVVNVSSTREALHNAPVMLISGNEALSFTDDEQAKLRQFVEDGGMIVGNADCDSGAFSKSFLKLGSSAVSRLRISRVAAHTSDLHQRTVPRLKIQTPMHLRGAEQPRARADAAPVGGYLAGVPASQRGTRPDLYHLFDDIVLYAMDTSGLERKGNSYIVEENPAATIDRTIKLARLQYAGNWDPEPGGWRRLAAVLHNNQKIALQVETVKLGDGSLITPPAPSAAAARPTEKEIRQMAAKRIPPAELNAALVDDPQKADAMIKAKVAEVKAEFDAAEAAKAAAWRISKLPTSPAPNRSRSPTSSAELKKFVAAGGTLIIDAAGGSTEFAASAEQLLTDTFAADAAQLRSPGCRSPIYREPGRVVEEVQYRQFARMRIGSIKLPQLHGITIAGRVAIIFSREDLSAGLVGEPVDGITGYSPASATELMTDILLYAK